MSYIFKRQERKFLLNHGVFVDWFKQVKGTRRVVAYGPLRAQMAKHATKGCQPVLGQREKKLRLLPTRKKKSTRPAPLGRSSRMSGVTMPDAYIGKRRRTNPDGSWSYWIADAASAVAFSQARSAHASPQQSVLRRRSSPTCPRRLLAASAALEPRRQVWKRTEQASA